MLINKNVHDFQERKLFMFNFPLSIFSTHACFIYEVFFFGCSTRFEFHVSRDMKDTNFHFSIFWVKTDNELKEMVVLIVNDHFFKNQNKKCKSQTFICTCKPNHGT